MAERVIALGDITEHLPSDPWIVVFGGVTRDGNRRARRAINAALQSDASVVWFDGFSERWGDREASGRVPIDPLVPDGKVVVVEYQRQERQHWMVRLLGGVPLEMAESRVATPGKSRVPVLTPLRRLTQRTLRLVHRKVLRRLFLVFRGMVGWKVVRNEVLALSMSTSAPRRIVYADDFALTIGWHSARLWPETPTSMDMAEK